MIVAKDKNILLKGILDEDCKVTVENVWRSLLYHTPTGQPENLEHPQGFIDDDTLNWWLEFVAIHSLSGFRVMAYT